jgi:hypothetical protein
MIFQSTMPDGLARGRRWSCGAWQSLARPLWAVSIVCATAGIFWFPWQFPLSSPANGESYALGFNNRLAVYSLALAIAAATAARLAAPKPSRAINWLAERPVLLPPVREARVDYAMVVVVSIIWTHVIWTWCMSLVDPAYGDSRVMIYAIDLAALGRIPYRDFAFNYGAAHIYLPLALSRATCGDVSFEHSYYAVLMLFIVVGFISIFWFLRGLQLPQVFRSISLLLALLSWLLFHTCTAHVAIRFLCVPTGLIVLHSARQRLTALTPRRQAAIAAALSFAYVMYCLMLSPEMGIAACFAMGGYAFAYAALLRSRTEALGWCSGAALAFVGILLVFPNYFLTVAAFSGGFGNLPIYPNLANVVVVASATYIFSGWIASALQHPTDHRSPLAIALSLAGGVLLVGCFGRAAPEHVFFNAMTPLLAMFAVVAQCGPLPQKAWAAAYLLLEILLLQVSHWWTHAGTLKTAVQLRQFYDTNPQVVAEWREQWQRRLKERPAGRFLHWSSVLPFPADLHQIEERGIIMQTGGAEWNLWLSRYLLLQEHLPRDFFLPAILSACTPEQIQQRLRDLHNANVLLVPENEFASIDHPIPWKEYEAFVDRWLGITMFFPVRSKVRFAPYSPDTIQAKELRADFKPVGRFQFFAYMPFIVLERVTAR